VKNIKVARKKQWEPVSDTLSPFITEEHLEKSKFFSPDPPGQ
jgi:hypothetical protein